ncbi:uncharacterized protein TNCV_2232821 [Trichonephila clavipes]|nr:uncharacterized protein TNCV_2232821 [Trichonephila clavipes]
MGDLPKDRVTLKRPFYYCGIDYAGQVSVLKYRGRGAKTTKGYIVIFVCFATKALHLELESDYTSETLIAALKRFGSRRSTHRHIHSDIETNIIGAKRKLGELLKHLSKITSEEQNLGGRTGKILRPSSVALKSKNQDINRLQLAVKLPWAIFFKSVDILS